MNREVASREMEDFIQADSEQFVIRSSSCLHRVPGDGSKMFGSAQCGSCAFAEGVPADTCNSRVPETTQELPA